MGGGFLSHHADALRGCLAVLIPVTFETYVERLRADATRPRLRPELTLDAELREIYFEREELHRAARPLALVDFLLRARQGSRPRRVVTLPPGAPAWDFAWRARHAGADLLEVRTDLTPPGLDLRGLTRALPVLVSQRGADVPADWLDAAQLVDRPLGLAIAPLLSLHAHAPLTPAQALAAWEAAPRTAFIKHVEPLGEPADAPRLLETQALLQARFGAQRVTVLATGPCALPFRAVLAARNALDYLALDDAWAAAPGQRLLADAVREWRRPAADRVTQRLGILGRPLAHSRSPRLHRQPFDRVEWPADAPLPALLAALHAHYRGFAVTAPFKKAVAQVLGRPGDAVNTLVREGAGWRGLNTDVEGARLVLERLGRRPVTVLGDGGVTRALVEAAGALSVTLTVAKHATLVGVTVQGPAVWTWPPEVSPPERLRFDGGTVAVVSYGKGARRIAASIEARGGVPLRLGAPWFVAQARAQREAWAG